MEAVSGRGVSSLRFVTIRSEVHCITNACSRTRCAANIPRRCGCCSFFRLFIDRETALIEEHPLGISSSLCGN